MAIDSEQKRKSAAGISFYINPPAVVPDGSFDAADRQHIAWGYSGILVGAGAAFQVVWARFANRLLDGSGAN